MSGIFLLWAIWGAIADWRYISRGGLSPTRKDKLFVLAAIGLSFAVMVLLGIMGGSTAGEIDTIVLLGTLIFGLWEFGRWRVRRKNPASETPGVPGFQDTKPQKGIIYTESELEAMKSRRSRGQRD
jgi:hypothetical protein